MTSVILGKEPARQGLDAHKREMVELPVFPPCPDCGGPRYALIDRDVGWEKRGIPDRLCCQHCLAKKDREDYRLKQGDYAEKPKNVRR